MAALPEFISPMLAKPGEVFDSDEHLFELKWDGTRTILLRDNKIRLHNRRLVDVTERSAPAVAVEVNGATITVLGVHAISPYGRGPSDRRDVELVSIGEWAADQSGAVVVAGDFNAPPIDAAVKPARSASQRRAELNRAASARSRSA